MASQNNQKSYTTRAGLSPSQNRLPYSITTTQVEEYLQKKLNVVVNEMKRNGSFNGDEVNVRVITVEMGTKFIPFMVVLPTEVLVQTQKKKNKPSQDELSIFNPRQYDGTANVLEPILKLFMAYMYDKKDGDAFYSVDWRRARGVATNTSAQLKSNRMPRITRISRGNSTEMVTFLIDPIRVFYDMLKIEDLPSDFHVEINDWQKQKSGEFRYNIERVINRDKKGKKNNSWVDQLNRKMRGLNN